MSGQVEKTNFDVVNDDLEAGDIRIVQEILENTRTVAEQERQLGVIEACKIYPKAMFWSSFFAIGIIMSGFDAQLIPSMFILPAFAQKYGTDFEGSKIISAAYQTALGMGNPIGQFLGAMLCGWPSEKWGRKKVLYACNIIIIGVNFIQFFAPSIQVLCAGEILAGIVWGTLITISPTYSSEVSPVALRGILTSTANLAFIIGQFIAQGVTAGLESRMDSWAYKAPFALQWLWPVLMLIGLPFAPESPWWLVRQGKIDEAEKALKSLAWEQGGVDLKDSLLVIEETNRLEEEIQNSNSYLDCFKGTNLRRTEIGVIGYLIPLICGNPLIAYCTYFFVQAGIPTAQSFNMGVGNTAIGFVGTCSSWLLMSYVGRRRIYNTGLFLMTIVLLIIGFLDIAPNYDTNTGFSWGQASLLDVWTFLYQTCIGPICFVIISDTSSTQLRSRTFSLATSVQGLFSVALTVAVPYMFNPGAGNLRGKTAFVFAAISLLCLCWSYFRLPETKSRTSIEIDIMFEKKIKTKDFKTYNALG